MYSLGTTQAIHIDLYIKTIGGHGTRKEVTIKELVNALQGKVIKVESADIYGVSMDFSKARIEYDEAMNILSFVAGNYNTPNGIGGVGIRIDDIVESITLEDDGSYTIEFNQYMADVYIKESNM